MNARREGATLARVVALTLAAVLAGGCDGLSDERAVRLVRAYNAQVIEAYRAGDARLVEGIVGPDEARKLTGLIGVKSDQGITLDSRLVSLDVSRVERTADQVIVSTEETWTYLDRRIGTGEQVGQSSTDRYRMRYLLGRVDGRWVVASIQFAEAPVVGRIEVPNHGPAPDLHGVTGAPRLEVGGDAW
ncbi:MAG: hypothetical protein ACYC8T_38410 [Myxococcaceae bacterium]